MLAKLWKKVLLAVCIIACIFNIMYKIVNRHSLKVNLESVNDGETVFDFGSVKENEPEEQPVYTENTENIVSENTNTETKHYVVYDENGNVVDEYEVQPEENIETNTTTKDNNGVTEYKDIFSIFGL